jgi:uncharacterized protein
VFEGDGMLNKLDDKIQQTNVKPFSLTHKLLGVLSEEEYFARQEAEQRRKLADMRQAKLQAEERESVSALHFMKCPKCGLQLEEIAFADVRIDKCSACEGLWLDKGELDLIRQKERGFMAKMLSVFG